jgi:hypothetical protein
MMASKEARYSVTLINFLDQGIGGESAVAGSRNSHRLRRSASDRRSESGTVRGNRGSSK